MSRGSVTVTPCLSPLAGYERRIINTLTFLLNRQMIASAYVPPHLYGQLVQHQEGAEVIANLPYLSGYFDIVSQKSSGECANVRESKAAIWAVVSVAVADPILFCISRLHQPSASAICISRLHQSSALAVCISRLHQPSSMAIYRGCLQLSSAAAVVCCSNHWHQSFAEVAYSCSYTYVYGYRVTSAHLCLACPSLTNRRCYPCLSSSLPRPRYSPSEGRYSSPTSPHCTMIGHATVMCAGQLTMPSGS